jgi:hypothetical protein
MVSARLGAKFWLVVLALTAVAIVVANLSVPSSRDIQRATSPDNSIDAVLTEFPHDAKGHRAFRVCLKGRHAELVSSQSCFEVVYLVEASGSVVESTVNMNWKGSSDLKVCYTGPLTATYLRREFIFPTGVYQGRLRISGSRGVALPVTTTLEAGC